LAGEPLPPSVRPGPAIGDALAAAARGAILTRVTMLASGGAGRTDAGMVLLRADYAAREDLPDAAAHSADSNFALPAPPATPGSALVVRSVSDGSPNLRLRGRAANYARTQGTLADAPKGVHIDVHA
jgi:hypothetical protein